MRVGRTSDAELAIIISEGGRRGEIYAGLKKLRDTYADLIRARYPDIPRRVSGYNLDDLLPENGFHLARALVGSESTLVTILEAVTTLPRGAMLRARTDRRPMHLYAQLEERGFTGESQAAQADGSFITHIRHR